MAAAICPWSFLAPLSSPSSNLPYPSPRPKSFAHALSNACDIPATQLPKPCFKGDALAIRIPEEEYQAGLEGCKNHIQGRLILSKGDAPIKVAELRAKLLICWKSISKWNLISLGKGYFEFSFASIEDMRSVFAIGSWDLKPGILKLSLWSPDFIPHAQRQTHTQTWVRILGLSQEYWRAKIIFSIASGIGTPIALDEATSKKTFGHFARVLVDIILNDKFHSKLLVEREGYEFFVGIEYEKLPPFCSHCQNIGHSLAACKYTKTSNEADPVGDLGVKGKPRVDYDTHETVNGVKKGVKSLDKQAMHTLEGAGCSKEPIVVATAMTNLDNSSLVYERAEPTSKDDIANKGAIQSNPLMGLTIERNVLEHSPSSSATGEQNLNKEVVQAIHEVFGSPSNTDGSFVVDANLLGSVAQDFVNQNVNCNHAKASDRSNEAVVQCTHVHVAKNSAPAAKHKRTPQDRKRVLAAFNKAISVMREKQEGASTSIEEEQNIDNTADDGFTMVKSKPKSNSQKQ